MIDTQIDIRTLSVTDYDLICEVWRESGIHLQVTGRESPEAFARQMQGGQQTVLGAYINDELAGVVLATHDGRKGWINRLGVLPKYQRQGVGTALINAADSLLHEQGMTIIAALVEHNNEASLNMFKRAGYLVNDSYYVSKRDHPNA